jgi:predicted phosphoribosyltransferase
MLEHTGQRFHDRQQAGAMLAERLREFDRKADTLVLGLPRAGVPVAYAVAERLGLGLDLLQVRKLGIPGNEALAMGAVSSEGICVVQPELVVSLDIPPEVIEAAAQRALREMKRCERIYRAVRPPAPVAGATVIVVDDGLATGATMQAAVRTVRQAHPARIVAAVPVGLPQTIMELRSEVDEVVCLITPDRLHSVDQWFEDNRPISDSDIKLLLAEAERWNVPRQSDESNTDPFYAAPAVPAPQGPAPSWQIER